MSQEPQRGMREPPPLPTQPPTGQFPYIPMQERSFGYSQPSVHPQTHPTASPGDSLGPHSLPPPDHSLPPPHLHANPPPMFTRPPPMPPRFSQPPPVMPHAPNIPYQTAFRSPVVPPRECNPFWLQQGPPSCPSQDNAAPVGVSKALSDAEEPEKDLKWLEEFESRVQNYPQSPPSPTAAKKIVKVITCHFVSSCIAFH